VNGPHKQRNAGRHEERVALITRLADRAELTELIFRVGLCLDEHRFEDLANLFVEDGAVVTPAGAARGRAALVAHATEGNARYDRMQHVTTNVLIDFEDDRKGGHEVGADADAGTDVADRARIRANIVAHLCQGADPHPVAARGGVSLGKAVRTAEGWRLTELEARPTWAVTAPETAVHGA
jgi:hypothetical protein